MISRPISQLRLTRQGLLSLALLPVFLCGTLPHIACICADGHREEHCRALSRHRSTAQTPSKSQCSCCKLRDEAPACCQAAEHGPQPQTRLSASANCCRPVVESPAPLVASAKTDVASKSTLLASVAPIADLSCTDPVHPAWQSRHLCTPPPLDEEIVYLHLTI